MCQEAAQASRVTESRLFRVLIHWCTCCHCHVVQVIKQADLVGMTVTKRRGGKVTEQEPSNLHTVSFEISIATF